MSRIPPASIFSASNKTNSGLAATTEHHVVKRILAALLAATCTLGASAANVAPTVALTAPVASANFIAPAVVAMSAAAADSDGAIASVKFYNGATLLITDTTAPYSFNWANVAVGTYSVTSRATDNLGAVTISAPVAVTVKANVLPTVAITAPAVGASLFAPAKVTMTASASDSDGTVARVTYYQGTTSLGYSSVAPYTVNWLNAAAGTYSVTAKATDDKGGITTSAPVTVVVQSNALPTVAMTAPATNATYAAPGSIILQASAADSDGSISKVDYYSGASLVKSATVAPYTANWTSVAIGSYVITARATDNTGGVTISAPINVTVAANVAPTVSISAPANNTSFAAPGLITLSAAALDSDGKVNSVSFYNGTVLLRTVTAEPFTYTWSGAAVGVYTVTAKAIDDKGAMTTSALISVTVKANVAPTASIASPAANAIFGAPANITVTANTGDIDGTVKRVAFYAGTTLIGNVDTAPFTFVWPNVVAGGYNLTVRATDDKGAMTVSAPVAIMVKATSVPTVSITAPANNAQFIAPATLTFTANAAVTGDTISKVEYFSGGNVVGMATTPPYTVTLNNIAAGIYSVTAKATGSLGGTATSSAVAVTVFDNAAPVVGLTANPTTAQAPAAITLTATPADTDGTIAKVEFYNGATLLATVTQAPYSYAWTNVAAGTYALTAKAFDNLGLATTSAVSNVAVTAPPAQGTTQVFYIYSDQINTAREITDAAGVKVWQADPDAFGANLPNENPAGQGQFTYNQRFPGQYFDRETGLHYNYYRDYDPQTGRYIQSDPIGLDGGINTYGYVGGKPLKFADPFGLAEYSASVGAAVTAAVGTPKSGIGIDVTFAITFSKSGISITGNFTKMDSVGGAYAGVGAVVGGGYGDEICDGKIDYKSDYIGAAAGRGPGIGASANVSKGGVGGAVGTKWGEGYGAFGGTGQTTSVGYGWTW